MANVTWFGHAAFKVEAKGVNVLLDPFIAPGLNIGVEDIGKVDLILITHDHGDHVGSAVEVCKKTGALVGCMVGVAQAMIQRGVPENRIFNGVGYNIGGSLNYRGVTAIMTQAFHSSDTGSPAGYIVKMPDGLVFYHAGDTGIFESMRLFGNLYDIHLAMLPIGGMFTMDAFQAAHACGLLGCDKVIPMHWGTFPALAQSPDAFRAELKNIAPDCQCIGMSPGETVEIEA